MDPSATVDLGATGSFSSSYREFVGSVLYLALHSRPDILNTVRVLTRALSAPTPSHLQIMKRLLRYLRQTSSLPITYHAGDELTLRVFSDADYAAKQSFARRSTSGAVILSGRTYILAHSTTQRLTASSSAESEYISAATAVKEITWIRE
eukprot:9622645-Prorocentrum_lima.AAC.1